MFVAAPFKQAIDPETSAFDTALRRQITNLIKFLSTAGYEVRSAHLHEAWGTMMVSPEECTRRDFEDINACEWLIAIPGSPASPGTCVELGWASALGHSARGDATAYGFEMSDEEHSELADCLHRIRGRAVVSGYRTELYDRLFRDWHRVDAEERRCSSVGTMRQESAWLNFPPPPSQVDEKIL